MKRHNLVVIHHDAQLYGADRSLVFTLEALAKSEFHPIVLLPYEGPLTRVLADAGVETHVGPVGKLERRSLRPTNLPRFLRDVWSAPRFISHAVNGRSVALVYSNSLAALGGAIWARRVRIPHLWQIREIVVAPALARHGLPKLVNTLATKVVTNSGATRQWLVEACPALKARTDTVWQGLPESSTPRSEEARLFREAIGVNPNEVLVTLAGRINRLKGHQVLVDAASMLAAAGIRTMRFLMIGDSPPGQEHYFHDLERRVLHSNARDRIITHPFVPDIWKVWAATDIAVVPSTEPESFGRVAIEAMAAGLPVVAAGHGGLREIVEHETTGLLVPPGDATSLAASLRRLAEDAELRVRMGEAGRVRQREVFSQSRHDARLLSLMRELVMERRGP